MAKGNQKAKNPQEIALYVVGSTTSINAKNIRHLNKKENACEKHSYAINAPKRDIWQENVKRTLNPAISPKTHHGAICEKRVQTKGKKETEANAAITVSEIQEAGRNNLTELVSAAHIVDDKTKEEVLLMCMEVHIEIGEDPHLRK